MTTKNSESISKIEWYKYKTVDTGGHVYSQKQDMTCFSLLLKFMNGKLAIIYLVQKGTFSKAVLPLPHGQSSKCQYYLLFNFTSHFLPT